MNGTNRSLRLWILGAVVATMFAGVAYANWYTWFPLEKKMAASLALNASGCDRDNPIAVTLTNNSRRTITRTDLEITVQEIGYSRDLEQGEDSTDKIIAPGEKYSFCTEKPNIRMERLVSS